MKNRILKGNKIVYFILFLISFIAYDVIYGLETLIPTNISWLMSMYHDWGQHYLGWAYYRDADWSFPLGKMDNFYYPVGTNVGFTDSIPLLAFVFKIFSFLLPEDFQYFGIWLLSCLFLNAFYTTKILKLFKVSNLVIYIAAVLIVTNPVIVFRGMHPALCAHWLILGSFYYYLVPTTKENAVSNYKKQGILFFLSATINPYLAIMVAGFNIVLAIKNYYYEKSISIKQVFLLPFLSIASGLFFWIIFGLIEFNKATNLDVGNIYGQYGFNLNSFFNSYGHYSKFIPHLGMVTDLQHEGFGYLGLGLLFLVITSIFVFQYFIVTKKVNKNHQYLLPLILLCTLMLFFAITNIVTYGEQVLFKYPTLGIIEKLGNIFRANGRFSWPFYYLLIIGSILIFNKLKFNTYVKYFVFVGLTFFQLYDIENLLTSRDLKYGSFDSKLDEEKWKLLLENFDEVITYPAYTNNMVYNMDYQDLMYVALKSHKPISIGYVARENVVEGQIFKDSIINSLKSGEIAKNRIYITNAANLKDFNVLIYKDKVNLKRLDGFIAIYSKGTSLKTDFISSELNLKYIDSVKNSYLKNMSFKEVANNWNSKENIQFNVEAYSFEDDVMQISGWAFNKSVSTNLNDSIFIALTNKGKTYLFPTTAVSRGDITAVYKKGNLDNSGFSTTLFTEKLPKQSYELGIVIKDQNGKYHYSKTDKLSEVGKRKYQTFTLINKLPDSKSIIMSNLETIENKNNFIKMSGWAALEKRNSINCKIKIVLLSKSKMYLYDTNLVTRNDVTLANENKYNYDYSGFEFKFLTKELPKGEYRVGVIIEDTNEKSSHYKQFEKKLTL